MRRDRQTDPVQRDRALLHQIPVERFRHAHLQPPVAVPSASRATTSPVASTCPCTMWPDSLVAGVTGRSRFTREPAVRSPRLLRESVSGARSAAKPVTGDSHCRETHAVHRDARADREIGEHRGTAHFQLRAGLYHRPQLFDDAGEHQSLRSTQASTANSSLAIECSFTSRNRIASLRRRRPAPPATGSDCVPPRIFGA